VFETYKNVTHEIRDQLNAEAEAVQIILTGIDNDIYSTIDACPNACKMWKVIERLKQEVMEQELRMKREAAERAFETQAEKDRTLMRLEELRFLATSTKDLDDVDAYWIKKQKRLIRNKMKNDLGAEDDEDEDE
nr:hypothetical protein [Tanacetum cinerariifolium]